MEDQDVTEKGDLEKVKKAAVDLEEALDIVGIGWYNARYCMVFAGFLISAILVTVGYSFVLPAGHCDLGMTDGMRGLVSSLPYIAVVITSHTWGYLADTRGRKPILLLGAFATGILGALASFMPDIISFAISKFIASLFMASPAGISFAYISEIVPRKYRDMTMSIVNACQNLGAAIIPLLGWLVLRSDFNIDFGLYHFRPWRMLDMLYSMSFVICGLLLLPGPESPKYLVSQGRMDEAMSVLQKMYAGNTGKKPEDYPVSAIRVSQSSDNSKDTHIQLSLVQSLKKQTVPLFRSPYLKWFMLNSFLLFGVFSTLNGLFMWIPDVLNRVMSGTTGEGLTACQIIRSRHTAASNASVVVAPQCIDYIETSTFTISAVANIIIAFISVLASISVQVTGKKYQLISVYVLIGGACIAVNFTTQTMVFAFLLSSIQMTALGIGPINAYTVQFFPTELRAMALGLTIMFGRTGSIFGTNVAGILINASCESTFFAFGGLLLVCALLSFLLPKAQN